MQQQMSTMLATPEGQAQMTAMLEASPMYQRCVRLAFCAWLSSRWMIGKGGSVLAGLGWSKAG